MRIRATLLAGAILLLGATAAHANLNAVNESTDEAGNTWKLYTGALAGGEVRELGGATHFNVSMLARGVGVGAAHIYVSEIFGVKELTMGGAFIRRFDEGGMVPNGIAEDPKSHRLYVAELGRVSVFLEGAYLESWSLPLQFGGAKAMETEGIAVQGSDVLVTERGFEEGPHVVKWHKEWEEMP